MRSLWSIAGRGPIFHGSSDNLFQWINIYFLLIKDVLDLIKKMFLFTINRLIISFDNKFDGRKSTNSDINAIERLEVEGWKEVEKWFLFRNAFFHINEFIFQIWTKSLKFAHFLTCIPLSNFELFYLKF